MLIDWALMLLWLALIFKNAAALLPLFILAANCAFIIYGVNEFIMLCVVSALYFTFAQTKLNIPLKLRYALLASGCVYWVGALDELLYNHLVSYQGVYYDVMPYLVLSLNAYIAAVISLDRGGRGIVGIADKLRNLVNGRIIRL
jgi:hypothetical protein